VIAIKILLDQLTINDLIFLYLATMVEEEGKPSTINDLIRKLKKIVKQLLLATGLYSTAASRLHQSIKLRRVVKWFRSRILPQLSDKAARKHVSMKLLYKLNQRNLKDGVQLRVSVLDVDVATIVNVV